MDKHSELKIIFERFGCGDHRFIDARDIEVAQWVRMKCVFGCRGYGKSLSCPPNTPSIAECRDFFSGYSTAVLFHFEKSVAAPEDRKPWSAGVTEDLISLEREVFLAGYHKAFMLPINECLRCAKCQGRKDSCPHPETVRPMPESMGVDLFATARKCGYDIEVLKNYGESMNRFAILMLE